MATYYNPYYYSNAADILAASIKKSEELDKEFHRRMSIINGMIRSLQTSDPHPENETIDSLTPSPKLSQVQMNTVMLESVAEKASAYAGDDHYDVNGNSSSEPVQMVSASTEPDLNSENIKSVSVDVTDESDKVENTMKIVSTDVVDWNDTLGFANSVCVLNCNRCKCSSDVCQNASMDRSSYFVTNRICIKSWCSPPPVKHTPVGFKSVLVLKVDDIGLKSEGIKSRTVVSSLNLCTKLVRRNVWKMFPFLLPPAKPPENILICVPRNGRVWFEVATAYSDKELYFVMLQSPIDLASREGTFEQLRSGTTLYLLAGATMADYQSGKLLWRLFLLVMLANMVSTSAGDGFIVVGLKTIKFDENNMLTASLDGAKVVLKFYKRYFLRKFIEPEAYFTDDLSTAIQKASSRRDKMMCGQKEWREWPILGDQIDRVFRQVEGLIWSSGNNDEIRNYEVDWPFEEGPLHGFHRPISGSTTCVAVDWSKLLIVAYVGDYRCAMSRNGQTLDISEDHNPDLELENRRVQKTDNFIQCGRLSGILDLARAIRGSELKQNIFLLAAKHILSVEQDVRIELCDDYEFLIPAGDESWDCMSSQQLGSEALLLNVCFQAYRFEGDNDDDHGAQAVWMGGEAKMVLAAAKLFKKGNDILGFDLVDLSLNGPKDKLNPKVISQPTIYVTSLVAGELYRAREGGRVVVDSGNGTCDLSLGEYTAVVVAEAFNFEDGLVLKMRGEDRLRN